MPRGWVEKHGNVYRLRYRHNGRIYTKSGYTREAMAKRQLNVILGDIEKGDWVDPRGADISMGEWLDYWLPTAAKTPATVAKLKSHVSHHIRPYWASYRIGSIRRTDVVKWVDVLSATLAPESVRNVYSAFGKAMGDAVAENLIRSSPCQRIPMPPRHYVERAFLNEDEVLKLYREILAAPEPVRRGRDATVVVRPFREQAASDALMVLTAAYTGLRWGELAGLSCGKVHRGVIQVRETLVEVGGDLSFKQPKTAGSVRDIPLPDFLNDLLVEHVRRQTHRLVFTDSEGGPLRRTNFARRVLQPAAKELKIKMSFHSLRHTHRALLIADGVPEFVIDVRMGHAPKGMAGLYSHVLPSVDKVVTDRLQQRWEHAVERFAPNALPNDQESPQP